ncbi:MAG: DUF2817 domain-containing protein [bacterium]|nr:DUF2817 domain-containing protein [bacterium]
MTRSIDPTAHFPGDYRQAREAFLSAAESAGARLTSHVLDVRGEDGSELALETAALGPAIPDSLLVVSSGIHGVEGRAGSALQHLLLTRPAACGGLPPKMGLLLVHALNPWGFDAGRRVNEHNVDLNRNFLRHPEEHEVRPDYERLKAHLNPVRLDDEADARARQALTAFAHEHGGARLQQALSAGQHAHPTGTQYGGQEAEPGNQLLRKIAREATGGVTRAAWIDVHTGLGPHGEPELITELPPSDPIYHRGRAWYGDAFRSTATGESVSASLSGVIEVGLCDEADPGCELTPFTAEFGTYPPERVFWALRADNWLHHHGDRASAHGRAIRSELQEMFSPADRRWQSAVLEAGTQVVRQARDGLLRDGLEAKT